MRSTRRNKRNALKAITLAFAAGAIFTGTASAQAHDHAASRASDIPYLSHGQGLGLPFQSTRHGGPVFMNGAPDGYTAYQQSDVNGGVTPTNLARAYVPRIEGVASPDGYQPQLRGDEPLIIRDAPDGFQPQTATTEVAKVSASSDGFEWNDVAIGFGLGLVLAMAGALALAIARNRTRIAHS
jgi:hypothetical protein